MKSPLQRLYASSLEKHKQIGIAYFGRVSEFLLVTEERLEISPDGCNLQLLLDRLRARSWRWQVELDEAGIRCKINGELASPQDRVMVGDEISIQSVKSIYEP